MKYVLGFVFNKSKTMVKLVTRKDNNKLDGFYGTHELSEGIYTAMSRLFKEKTGVEIENPDDWQLFGELLLSNHINRVIDCLYIINDEVFKKNQNGVVTLTINDLYTCLQPRSFTQYTLTLINAALECISVEEPKPFITIQIDD